MDDQLKEDRRHLLTEQRLAESAHLDTMTVEDAVDLMNRQDALAVAAVASQRQQVAAAVKMVAAALRHGGRLIYVGAGTSGRLGVLDASECPPTFSVDLEMVQGIIAGGDAAMFKSREGAEDRPDEGAAAIDQRKVGPADVVMGIATGGTTPFVHGALNRARQCGAKTIFFCCVQPRQNEPPVDLIIRPLTGPEVLTGSTRLKAGTATKLVLNQISTLAMVQLGKVYGNLMVDLKCSNIKLKDRALRIVMEVTRLSRQPAEALLASAHGEVKLALAMHLYGLDTPAAKAKLAENGDKLG